MKRNFTRVDRVAQMTMQEELIAKKKLEILEKQRTKEIGKQIAAAQKNVTTSVSISNDIVSDEEEKQKSGAEITPSTNSIQNSLMANIPKLQNNFCNDGSFFEYYTKIIEQTQKEEEAKKQVEAKLKKDVSNFHDNDEERVETENLKSDSILEGLVNDNGQVNINNEIETPNSKIEGEESANIINEQNCKHEIQTEKIDEIKTELVENNNVNKESLLSGINSSNQLLPDPSSLSDSMTQFGMTHENPHYNQNFQTSINSPSIQVTTRSNYLHGPYNTQLTSQSNPMPIHIPQAFNISSSQTFNLNLPPPMINFTIQQPTPPPPPPPMPVLLPLAQTGPNLFQNTYSNPSIFLMQHQTPQQITIPYQQPQQITLAQPPSLPILSTNSLPQVTMAQPISQSSVIIQNSNELSQSTQLSPVSQTLQQFQTESAQMLSSITNDESNSIKEESVLKDISEETKDTTKTSSNSESQNYQSSRSNTNSPIIEKDNKNIVFSEDSKRIEQTKNLLPTSLQSCIDMVAENGDAFEDFIRSNKDEVHSSLWFLFDLESDEYEIYRRSIVKAREEIRNRKRSAIYKSNDEKYDPESVCDERDDNDSDDEYMKGMLNRNTNNLKRRIETRVEFEEEERRQEEEDRLKKRKSRWGEKIESILPPSSVTAVVQTSFANQNKPMLSVIQRTDPALLQYAKLNYGGVNLSEEDWKKCEEHFKVNLLYQDMMKKRREIDQLAKTGKFKYEYDSDEDVEGGTWEHKLRMAEMEATDAWAHALTKQSEGKHHIGDFLPPEELKKFMEQYEAKKNNRQPDLSDYKEFKLKEDNKGFQMLQKLGWQEGQGLGADGDGIIDPINKATQREANQGLGANSASTPGDNDNEYEAYRKRMMLAYRFRPNPLNNPRRAYY